jgi:hypothetical protein
MRLLAFEVIDQVSGSHSVHTTSAPKVQVHTVTDQVSGSGSHQFLGSGSHHFRFRFRFASVFKLTQHQVKLKITKH